MAKTRQRWWSPKTRLHVEPLAVRILEAIDTPVSLGVYLRLKHGEHEQLAKMSVDPRDYTCSQDFFLDYQAVSLLSKFNRLRTGIDTKLVAMKGFVQSEIECLETNERFFNRHEEGLNFPPHVNAVLHGAQRKIAEILGDAPLLEELRFSFGPGACYGVRRETSVYNKVLSKPECTSAMSPILERLVTALPGWFPTGEHVVTLRHGSELTVVPKNAKTDRPICIEPLLNGFVQAGLGSAIRDRLGRWGVNLSDQGVNQRLAAVAHVNRLATVDFRSASDTISYAVVLDLIPGDWFELLDAVRSPCYKTEELWYPFHKFSSMGNGYTFELETLLFYALAFSTCRQLGVPVQTGSNLSVYGDDVIIPSEAFDLFKEVCSLCGFSVNSEKTYTSGNFYESCGCDYFDGLDVRPYLLKKEITSLTEMYHAVNTVLRIAGKAQELSKAQILPSSLGAVVGRLRDVHAWAIGCIPKWLRFCVPDGAGDAGLVADFDVATPQSSSQGWCGWWYRRVNEVAVVKRPVGNEYPMAYALYYTSVSLEQPGDIPRVWHHNGRPLDLPRSKSGVILPDTPTKGDGYTVRNNTRFHKAQAFWHGQWPLAPCVWSEKAVAMV